MYDADGFIMRRCPLQLFEEGVEKGIIVVREVDAVRIVVEEFAVILKSVVLHLEAGVHGIQDRIDIHFCLCRIAQCALVGSKTERKRADWNAIGRGCEPQHAQHGENAQEKYEYLPCFHSEGQRYGKTFDLPLEFHHE